MTLGMRGDATAMCERLAQRLLQAGAVHPAAGAVAMAARGHVGISRQEFADLLGLDVAEIGAFEDGDIPFGCLPRELGWVLEQIEGLDLLALADLARSTRCGTPAVACQHAPSCFDA